MSTLTKEQFLKWANDTRAMILNARTLEELYAAHLELINLKAAGFGDFAVQVSTVLRKLLNTRINEEWAPGRLEPIPTTSVDLAGWQPMQIKVWTRDELLRAYDNSELLYDLDDEQTENLIEVLNALPKTMQIGPGDPDLDPPSIGPGDPDPIPPKKALPGDEELRKEFDAWAAANGKPGVKAPAFALLAYIAAAKKYGGAE